MLYHLLPLKNSDTGLIVLGCSLMLQTKTKPVKVVLHGLPACDSAPQWPKKKAHKKAVDIEIVCICQPTALRYLSKLHMEHLLPTVMLSCSLNSTLTPQIAVSSPSVVMCSGLHF